ncbi:hypothetical protein EDM80_14820 [bacterium]|nr:MAG: hypothetical protein EDM80_14820 [bacterium]RIK59544.1 MAG: hypothetical protein DCC64_15730 [Planctomycetota bacterium]
MVQGSYNLTDEVAYLTHLLAQRVADLAHIQPGRILHGVSQARSRSRYGVYAQCHALRFKGGARELESRHWKFVWPEIRVRGVEILYYITYFLPRFLDQPPPDRLRTLVHELYHISPKFNGDLRRFGGRNEFHGSAQDDFDGEVDRIARKAEREIDLARFHFLQHDFEGLTRRFGAVVGNRLKRFAPRRVKPDSLRAAPAPVPSGSQRLLLFG